MKLRDCVKLIENNSECVILETNSNSRMNLICLGCFRGNEKMIRLTKGKDVVCTIWTDENKSYSWHWGYHGYTLVTADMDKKGRLIQECIERDFGIRCLF